MKCHEVYHKWEEEEGQNGFPKVDIIRREEFQNHVEPEIGKHGECRRDQENLDEADRPL